MKRPILTFALVPVCIASHAAAQHAVRVEVSADGRDTVLLRPSPTDGTVTKRGAGVPLGTTPDWQNTQRRQVSAVRVADMNNDGWNDLVVGCYISSSFPPYDEWTNLIYYNIGGELEAEPSWISSDQVHTTDLQVGDINGDGYLDIFSANGGGSFQRNRIYFGGPDGPDTIPDWTSAEPISVWSTHVTLFDIDHDGDLDVVTTNQGITPNPYRPMYMFRNQNGVLDTVPSWQSSESSIQNNVAFGDYDGDGWEEMAVTKWTNGFQSGIYENNAGELSSHTVWTTGVSMTDRGVAWADVDGNGWLDLIVGRNPTTLFSNNAGVLTQTWTASAPFYSHNELMFIDVDGDGDPDLAETHFGDGRSHVYLNNNGTLDSVPTWTYDSTAVGTALDFGDINGDGLPDMVIGYSGQPSVVVFYNTGAPNCVGDLNGDNNVDLEDLAILIGNFGESGGPADGDFDGNGEVDLGDLALLIGAFGEPCP